MDPNEEQNEIIDLGMEESVDKELPFCRFCWDNESTVINPLLSSCKCKGGVQYIHYLCLKEWIKTKRQSKESPNMCSYYWKAFECEICKTSYPYVFKANNHKYCLIDSAELTSKYDNYMILESLNLEKNTSRMVHIISPDALKNAFKIGRGHDSDIRVNDISVSRCHAVIRFQDNSFYLQDEKSKFGTLVLIKNKLHLQNKQCLSVQVGRSVVNFLVRKSPPGLYKIGKHKKNNPNGNGGGGFQHDALTQLYLNTMKAEQYLVKQ
jgi:hypothetical protein